MTHHHDPLDGMKPQWVSHHDPANLQPARRNRPRWARVADMTVTTMTLEAHARALAPSPNAGRVIVERHIVSRLLLAAIGKHTAPITDETVTRAYSDYLTEANR